MAIATKGAGGKQGDATFAGITLSNPGKVYYPDIGVTKLDVARYYELVAPLMLPYVAKSARSAWCAAPKGSTASTSSSATP